MTPTHEEKIEAAKAFGDYFGWKLSDKPFGVDVLARNGVWSTDYWLRGASFEHIDHAYYYRKNRRAVAIACHLYHVPEDIHEWAAEHGLLVGVSDDKMKSWYYPGETTLVVYVAASPRQTGAHNRG